MRPTPSLHPSSLCRLFLVAAVTFTGIRTYGSGPPCIPCDPTSDPQCGSLFASNPVELLDDPSLRDVDNVDGAQRACVLSNLTSATNLDGLWANTSLTTSRYQPPYDALRSVDPNYVDEVTAYYHADRAKRYLDSLGFPDVMDYSIPINAHDPSAGDNSYYSAAQHALILGTGGVDNAQDPDAVYHGYAYAILDDQVPGFGTSQEGATLAAGFAVYWAAAITDDSFATALGKECFAAWDATAYNPYNGMPGSSGCASRVHEIKQYPRDLTFEVHDDSEIWSAALWRLRTELGDTLTDTLVIKSHSFLAPDASFVDAADALLSADAMLYAGSNSAIIDTTMASYGIPRSGTPAASGTSHAVSYSCETAHPYGNLSNKECHYTVLGAAQLRFHFSMFSTEADNDVVHISDGLYREVQVLSGSPFVSGSGFSAAVQGNTIVARFKSDVSITASGFAIDQVAYNLAPVTCPNAPAGGCRTSSAGQLQVKKGTTPAKDKLTWSFRKGPLLSAADFGDPTDSAGDGYAFCVYDDGEKKLDLTIPAGSFWAATRSGFQYKDRDGNNDGVTKVKLHAGDAGKSSLQVRATGIGLDMPAAVNTTKLLNATSAVVAQLHRNGDCWETTFEAADSTHKPTSYKGRFRED